MIRGYLSFPFPPMAAPEDDSPIVPHGTINKRKRYEEDSESEEDEMVEFTRLTSKENDQLVRGMRMRFLALNERLRNQAHTYIACMVWKSVFVGNQLQQGQVDFAFRTGDMLGRKNKEKGYKWCTDGEEQKKEAKRIESYLNRLRAREKEELAAKEDMRIEEKLKELEEFEKERQKRIQNLPLFPPEMRTRPKKTEFDERVAKFF